jgi:hypothetical protein
LAGLDSILTAIEQWIKLFFEIPLMEFVGCPFAILSQFTHCMILLFKLMSLDEPGWDHMEIRKRADLFEIIEHLAQRLESIPTLFGLVSTDEPEEKGIFFKASRILRALKVTFSAEINQSQIQRQSRDTQNALNLNTTDPVWGTMAEEDLTMYLTEDQWWADVFHVQGPYL